MIKKFIGAGAAIALTSIVFGLGYFFGVYKQTYLELIGHLNRSTSSNSVLEAKKTETAIKINDFYILNSLYQLERYPKWMSVFDPSDRPVVVNGLSSKLTEIHKAAERDERFMLSRDKIDSTYFTHFTSAPIQAEQGAAANP